MALFLAVPAAVGCSSSSSPTEFVITFESNGGTHINTQKVKKGEVVKEPTPAPTKTDYTFGGWFISPDFVGGEYDFSVPVTGDFTLYANWNEGPRPVITHTITFVLNGATSNPIEPVLVNDGNLFPSDKIPAAPTNPGHAFEGWSDKENTKSIVDLTKTTINSDLILYAWWGNSQSIDITFDANGGYFDTTTTTTKVVPTAYGQVPVAPTPTKVVVGKTSTFKGWDKTLQPAKPASEEGITTYKAQWDDVTNTCHVTFDANGGTITSGGEPCDVDYGGKIATAPIVTREGYGDTTGWYDAPTGGTRFAFGTTKIITNLILYAHWGNIKTYKVIFSANGGTYSETNKDTVTRENVPYNTMPEIPDPPIKIDSSGIKAYTFVGYNKNVVPVTGDSTTIAYTAQWKIVTIDYVLTINGNGGHFSDGSTTKSFNLYAGTNIKSFTSTLSLTLNDSDGVKTLDKFVYDNGNEISDDDIVNKNGIIIKATYRNKTLEECSWDEISTISERGKDFAKSYFGPINPETPLIKTVIVNNQPHTVRIIGYGQDVDVDGNEIGITFEFANLISDENGYSLATFWNDTDNEEWDATSDYLNSTIRKNLTGQGNGSIMWYEKDRTTKSDRDQTVLDMLPSELRNVLKISKKKVNLKTTGSWISTEFIDKLFLLSCLEIGDNSKNNVELDATTYKYYEPCIESEKFEETRLKSQVKGSDGCSSDWVEITDGKYEDDKSSAAGMHTQRYYGGGHEYWLRSPMTEWSSYAFFVDMYKHNEGEVDERLACSAAIGVAPAFCV